MNLNAFDNAAMRLYCDGYDEGYDFATKEYETKSKMRLTLETKGFMMGLTMGILVLGPIIWTTLFVLIRSFLIA